MDVILAMSKNQGIGLNGKLPWECREELKLFRKITTDRTCFVGAKTALPVLKNRAVYVLHRHGITLDTMSNHTDKVPMVIGGGEIYNQVLSDKYYTKIRTLYLSVMKQEYTSDVFVNINFQKFITIKRTEYDDFIHYELEPADSSEHSYQNLLREVLTCEKRMTRNGFVFSRFGKVLRFYGVEGFPLLTTKKMFFRGIVEELLFFLRGDTDTKKLEEKGVNIWKKNTEKTNGLMGPMYGYQWRHFDSEYNWSNPNEKIEGGFDQLTKVINEIRTDPTSRRILMTTFNPKQASQGVLYPCHSLIIQFYVDGNTLDMTCYNRSQDLFLGTPFNIASSFLLLEIVAKLTGKFAGELIMFLGDCHVYESHETAVREQLERSPFKFPRLLIKRELSEKTNLEIINEFEAKDFVLLNYESHSPLKAEMIA